jgi:hypothetical protein
MRRGQITALSSCLLIHLMTLLAYGANLRIPRVRVRVRAGLMSVIERLQNEDPHPYWRYWRWM